MHRFIDEEMSAYEKAHEELKRVDHLVYVSLKYTRTVDVIKNTIQRMISCFDCIMEGLLYKAEDEGKLFQMPVSPGAKVNEIKKIYGTDPVVTEMLTFYGYLRKVHKAEYSAIKEFRRHVAMLARMADGQTEEINIDVITEFYHKSKVLMDKFKDYFPHE
ncbi:MAG: hypothetical protein ACMXYK_00855 [Candidatus Woesearchaeota archaeon]